MPCCCKSVWWRRRACHSRSARPDRWPRPWGSLIEAALTPFCSIAGQLYRIAQEALLNAAKHSRATQIQVSFVTTAEGVMLAVRDNGIGLPERMDPHRGMGMATMSYRARMIGASFQLGRAPGGGTEVVCTLKSVSPAKQGPGCKPGAA